MIQKLFYDPLKNVYIVATFNGKDIIDVHIYQDYEGRRYESCLSCSQKPL